MLIVKLVLVILVLLLGIPFALLSLKSSEFDDYFENLENSVHPLKKAYPIALELLAKLNFDYQSNRAKKLRSKLDVLYGRKYSEYYVRVTYGECISTAWIALILGITIACFGTSLSNCLIIAVLTVVLSFLLYYYYFTKASQELEKLSQKYMSQFPNVVSSIALLVNAGMILREAWEQVAYSDNKEINTQMQIVCDDIKNGISEKDAYYAFAVRCASPDIKKFISFLTQAMDKGNKDLANVLVNQSSEMWTVRRESALKQGELASNKLLIPILIIFVGILIMVMGPIMSNMSA